MLQISTGIRPSHRAGQGIELQFTTRLGLYGDPAECATEVRVLVEAVGVLGQDGRAVFAPPSVWVERVGDFGGCYLDYAELSTSVKRKLASDIKFEVEKLRT